MIWSAWILVIVFAFGALVTVTQVGQPRGVTSGRIAALVVAIDAVMIYLVLHTAGVL